MDKNLHTTRESRAFEELDAKLQKLSGGLAEGDEERLIAQPPSKPLFPLFMLMLSLTKDTLDMLDLTLVGVLLTIPFSIIFAFAMFFWCTDKLQGGWWKKMIIRWLWRRFMFVIVIELFPFFKIIPANTILVLMAHHHESKIVKTLTRALEALRGVHTRGGNRALKKVLAKNVTRTALRASLQIARAIPQTRIAAVAAQGALNKSATPRAPVAGRNEPYRETA